jgi:hypothetical protein
MTTLAPERPQHTWFDSWLEVREDGRYWLLLRPLTYRGARDIWTIPAGFRTDLASVPRMLTWLVPVSGEHNRAVVLHDYLCRQPGVSYRDADEVLRIAAAQLQRPPGADLSTPGVTPTRVALLYAGVRVGHEVLGLGDPTKVQRVPVYRAPLTLASIVRTAWASQVAIGPAAV